MSRDNLKFITFINELLSGRTQEKAEERTEVIAGNCARRSPGSEFGSPTHPLEHRLAGFRARTAIEIRLEIELEAATKEMQIRGPNEDNEAERHS